MAVKSRTRETDVKLVKDKKKASISCPFCEVPHPIGLEPSPCGTVLKIKAVQKVYTGVTCALCGKSGGTFIQIGKLYAHTPNCMPGRTLLSKQPKMSKTAKVIHTMPNRVSKFVAKRFGWMTLEITKPGTTETLGYSWVRMPK